METQLAALLAALPRLGAGNPRSSRNCKICGKPAAFFDATDFWKGSAFYPFGPSGISVPYYRCDSCGFMFTPLCDDWSSEEFAQHIYNDQYRLLDGEYLEIRPKRTAEHVSTRLKGFEDARILDYGSGTGKFASHMRAAGFRYVFDYDPFSQPSRPSGRFDVVTCVEVIEHSPKPVETILDIASFLNDDACVLLGESLQPPDISSIRCNWWYCMPRNGHVSLYTDRSLATAALQARVLFHRGQGLHAFSRPSDGRFASIADRISLPLFPVSLTAPQEQQDGLWHALEVFSGMPTRWTASPEISWRVVVPSRRKMVPARACAFLQRGKAGIQSRKSDPRKWRRNAGSDSKPLAGG